MIVLATTMAAYVTDDPDTSEAWLYSYEDLAADAASAGHDVVPFVALQLDARGLEPFTHLLDRMAGLNPQSQFWTYTLNDGRKAVTTANRLRHLTVGQNLCVDFALSNGASHLLFMAADCAPSSDIRSLLALNEHIVGGQVDTYCLDGPIDTKYVNWLRQRGWRGDEVRCHMPTAAYVLIRSDILDDGLRWRWSAIHGSDDPCMYRDAVEIHGVQPVVHHGVRGKHYPESIPAIEERGHDRKVY